MKFIAGIRKSLKIVAWTLMTVFLLLCAVLLLLYSPWSQDHIRQFAVETLCRQGMPTRIDYMRLRFPLELDLAGVAITMPGQTIKADSLSASVRLLPLLAGKADISHALLHDGEFIMGRPDSAMYMVIQGKEIKLSDASVGLASMDINLSDGYINGGLVSLTMTPDSVAPADTAASKPTEMKINVKRLRLNDFGFQMSMLPTIDSLGAHIPQGQAESIAIDLLKQTIDVGGFTGQGLNAAYIAPDSATIAATPVAPQSTDSTAPWTIKIDTIGFSHSQALYTTRGVKPLPGLDFAYIQADSLDLSINDFYNQATNLSVPMRLSATERCGVRLNAAGKLVIDSKGLSLVGFNVDTPLGTELAFNYMMGMGDLTADPTLPLRLNLDGGVSVADARLMFPAFTPYFMGMPRDSRLLATIDMDGTTGSLNVKEMALTVNGMAKLRARGTVDNAFDFDNIGGDLTLSGALIDLNSLKGQLLSKEMARQVKLPLTTFDGHVDMNQGHIAGNLIAKTLEGRISLDADWHSRQEDYDVSLVMDHFPVNAFMPLLGVGQITASLDAKGHGYNPFKPTTGIDATLDVKQAVYQGYNYSGISGKVLLDNGQASVDLASTNPNALFDLQAAGNLDGATYDWTIALDGRHIDLHALHLAQEEASVSTDLRADVSMSSNFRDITAKMQLNSLSYKDKITTTDINDVTARFNTSDSATTLQLRNRDLYADVQSPSSLDSIMASFAEASRVIDSEMKHMLIAAKPIQDALPDFTLDLTAGKSNFLNDILAESRMSFNQLNISASNDSILRLKANLLDLKTGTTTLDTITMNVSQLGDSIVFKGALNNAPGTFDEWAHVRILGFMAQNHLGMLIDQHNIKGQQGYRLGMGLTMIDSVATLHLAPRGTMIAYKPWTINDDNFIKYSLAHKHLDANLHMKSDESSLAVYTEHREGDDEHQEEVVLNISDINIADWIKLNPFAPSMTGLLSADMRVNYHDNSLNGNGYLALNDFTYDRQRVGSIRTDIDLSTDLGGMIRAKADLLIDGQRAMALTGALNDSTAGSPLAMDLSLIHFPLATANPFLPAGTGSLRGTLNGSMDVTGHGSDPKLNGWLQFDSAAVHLAMTGTDYRFNDVKIPVDSSTVKFNDFEIYGTNDNPLMVNGSVDIEKMSDPRVDLSLRANNMMIVNSKKASRGANIYGKGYINLDASARGNMEFMAINANLTVLSGTNLTYVMTEEANALTAQGDQDMVKFVNFSDTAAVVQADSLVQSSLAMLVDANLTIQSGSTIEIDLSSLNLGTGTNARNRVSLQPQGTLDFNMPPFGASRLIGRLNIPKGFVRFTPPFMSEKNFSFDNTSYVAFNGDMMNPVLNIHATDVVKANVTQQGQNSRLVNFDVKLSATGTLEHMDVAFDLSTDDDITVANELQAMSPEQRANQAMNMLLYNIYTGPGTRGDSNLSGNAVYSFLTSQLNNWAANTIKGVDLTFGVDQYDRTVGGSTSQTTSYSYEVSKSLFNDRFKIVVGGNYTTDANADENFSQNLIKDISFEYFLNKAQTMYIRIFRHTGYESILEGEVTKTGVGFVYKRKGPSLRSLFLPRRRPKTPQPAQSQAPAATDSSTPQPTKDESK